MKRLAYLLVGLSAVICMACGNPQILTGYVVSKDSNKMVVDCYRTSLTQNETFNDNTTIDEYVKSAYKNTAYYDADEWGGYYNIAPSNIPIYVVFADKNQKILAKSDFAKNISEILYIPTSTWDSDRTPDSYEKEFVEHYRDLPTKSLGKKTYTFYKSISNTTNNTSNKTSSSTNTNDSNNTNASDSKPKSVEEAFSAEQINEFQTKLEGYLDDYNASDAKFRVAGDEIIYTFTFKEQTERAEGDKLEDIKNELLDITMSDAKLFAELSGIADAFVTIEFKNPDGSKVYTASSGAEEVIYFGK